MLSVRVRELRNSVFFAGCFCVRSFRFSFAPDDGARDASKMFVGLCTDFVRTRQHSKIVRETASGILWVTPISRMGWVPCENRSGQCQARMAAENTKIFFNIRINERLLLLLQHQQASSRVPLVVVYASTTIHHGGVSHHPRYRGDWCRCGLWRIVQIPMWSPLW